jgi:NhaP-type Na+/H+ or K+/H+ antiporter
MKELLLIGTTIFTIATSSVTAGTVQGSTLPQNIRGQHISVAIIHKAELKTEAQAELLQKIKLQENTDKVNKAIDHMSEKPGMYFLVLHQQVGTVLD